MKKLPENIRGFFEKNRVATICVTDGRNMPYCFTCFFVISGEHPTLVFKSSYGTAHEDATRLETEIAGTVLPEKLDLLKIKGIQFTGHTLNEADIDQKLIFDYYNKYPFGRVMPGYIWAVKLRVIKFTDNTNVFGQKTFWNAEATT
jgi:uncharacterized protein YhbP (UPF0306 family)